MKHSQKKIYIKTKKTKKTKTKKTKTKKTKTTKTKKIKIKTKKINNHYKINKKGGSYDDKFLNCFDENLKKIEDAIQTFSGKHSIDTKIANEFISSQISPIRRHAAEDLVNNTIYITLDEISNIIEKLIDKLYLEFQDINNSDKIYLVTGNIKKSSYFLSVLALKYIKVKQYKEPHKFIEVLTPELFEEIGNNPIIMIDDVSYTGSQLSNQLNQIYYDIVVMKKKTPPNIYVLLAALNDISKQKLSIVPTSKIINKYYDKFIESPFKLLYLNERLYEALIYKLGIERYLNMTLLFSTFSAVNYVPYVSIYLDHKLADDVSTFNTTLTYGQIIPNNINFNKLINNDILLFDKSYKEFDGEMINKLLNTFNKDNMTNFSAINFKTIGSYILEKLVKQDEKYKDKDGVSHLTFKPFINTCNTNPKLLENISDNEVVDFDYFLFMIPEGCLEGNNNCSIDSSGIDSYKYLMFDEENRDLNKNIIISNKIHGFRCPETWYKNGEFEMSCIN